MVVFAHYGFWKWEEELRKSKRFISKSVWQPFGPFDGLKTLRDARVLSAVAIFLQKAYILKITQSQIRSDPRKKRFWQITGFINCNMERNLHWYQVNSVISNREQNVCFLLRSLSRQAAQTVCNRYITHTEPQQGVSYPPAGAGSTECRQEETTVCSLKCKTLMAGKASLGGIKMLNSAFNSI